MNRFFVIVFVSLGSILLVGGCGVGDKKNWLYEESTDPFDDTITKSISLLSSEATLTFSCSTDQDLTVSVLWKEYIGENTSDMKLRVGTKDTRETSWAVKKNISFDNDSTVTQREVELLDRESLNSENVSAYIEQVVDNFVRGIKESNSVSRLVADMIGESKFVIRATKDDGTSVDATFDITGIDSAIQPILEYCDVDLNVLESEEDEAFTGPFLNAQRARIGNNEIEQISEVSEPVDNANSKNAPVPEVEE